MCWVQRNHLYETRDFPQTGQQQQQQQQQEEEEEEEEEE